MRLELEHGEVDLAPGEQVSVGVRVHNDGAVPIDVSLGIAGLDADGVRPVAELGVVAPGTVAATTLVFALPKGSLAGLREVAIRAVDRLDADAGRGTRTARLGIRVRSTERLSLALRRNEVWGRFRGKVRADLRNQGTEPITIRLWGEGDDLTVRFEREVITLDPGHGALVKGIVRRERLSWRGEHRRPFVVTAQGHSTPRTTSGSYVQRGIIPGPFFLVLAVLIVGCVWVAGLFVAKDRLLDNTSTATTTTAVAVETTGVTDTTTPGTGGPDDTGTGTPDTGGEGDGGTKGAVPVSIIGAVDGPAQKAGTVAVLSLLTLGDTSTESSLRTKVAAFAPAVTSAEPVSTTQRTVTDEDGRFRFDDLTQTPGLYRLTLFRTGFDVFSQVVNVDGSSPNVEVTAKLVPAAGALGGRVVDDKGNPLGGVAITVASDGLNYTAVSADGTGVWQVAGVGTPATYLLQFAKAGYAAASLVQPLDGGQSVSTLVATMKAGSGTLRGVVKSTQGSDDNTLVGVGGLKVTLALGDVVIETTTLTDDPIGFFEFPGIDYGTYALTIEGPGWQTIARGVDVQSGLVDLGVVTAVSATATITGSVTQEAKPNCVVPYFPNLAISKQLACGGVGITAQGAETYRTTSASGTGSYQLAGIPPGTYLLTVERFGYESVTLSVSVLAGDTLYVDPVALHVKDNSADANGTLALNISTVGEKIPMAGTVAVLGQVLLPVRFGGNGETEVAVEIENLLPGSYKVVIKCEHAKTLVITVQIPLSGSSEVYDVHLVPLGTLGGVITAQQPDHSTLPVPGAVVFVTPTDAAATELVSPPNTPVPPSSDYLRRDPTAVGQVRLCERNLAADGAPENWTLGLCALTDTDGSYTFDAAFDGGAHTVYAPMNLTEPAEGAVALDHVVATSSVTTVLDSEVVADVELHRLGAVVGTVRTVDLSTGTTYSTITGFTVSATLCEDSTDSGAILGCRWPSSGGAYDVAKGRSSYGTDGEYRLDRLADTAEDYLLRFQKVGFVDSFRRVGSPALDTDVSLNVVMLPEANHVRVNPGWVKAGTTDVVSLAATAAAAGSTVSVTFKGIVSYTDDSPPVPLELEVVDTIASDGIYDSGDTRFVAGTVSITIEATGFDTLVTSVPIDPSGAAGPGIGTITREEDLTGGSHMILTADATVTPLVRALDGQLDVVCCAASATFVPTSVARVYDQLEVSATTPDGTVFGPEPLSATGAYHFADLVPGDYTITFAIASTTPLDLTGHITMPDPEVVAVGTVDDATAPTLVAALDPAELTGTVIDSDDSQPIEGASVTLITRDGATIVRHQSTTTDVNGEYRLIVKDVPGDYEVLVESDDGRAECSGGAVSLTPGGSSTVSVSCKGPRGIVEGTVEARDSATATSTEPLANATVELRNPDTHALVATTVTDTDGTFHFDDVPTGRAGMRTYDVVVTMEGFTSPPAASVTVYPNQICVTVPSTIVLVAATRPLTVTVLSETVDDADAPVPLGNVTVTATLSGADDVSATTDSNGVVVLDLTPGNWTLTTSGANAATALDLTAPHHDSRIFAYIARGTGGVTATMTLEGPFVSVSGRVLGTLNDTTLPQPLAGATVFITTSRGVVPAITDEFGAYSFDLKVPVEFAATTNAAVMVSATDYDFAGPAHTTLSLVPNSDNVLDDFVLTATPLASVFRVKGRESGANLEGVRVTAVLDGSSTTESGISDEYGNVTLHLAPGTWAITTSFGATALAGGIERPHGDVTATLVVVLGVTPDTTVLRPAALVPVEGLVRSVPSGDVGTFDSRVLAGASLIATRVGDATPIEPDNTFLATSTVDGYAIGKGLTPGTWRITASAPGHTDATIEITVTAGEAVADAHIDLTELPMHLSGVVTSALGEPVPGVDVRFKSVDGQQLTVHTDADGRYSVDLAASVQWEVRFDPRAAGASYQNVPVLYRYVGSVMGDTDVTLDHQLFADVVSLTVTVKGVLPTRCSPSSCVEHDLSGSAAVTIGDSGHATGGTAPADSFVEIPSLATTVQSGAQVALFDEIPEFSTYSLDVTADGYADGGLATLDLTDAAYRCGADPDTMRCVTVDLDALNRDVQLTITDVHGDPVTDAAVRVRSKPPSTDISISCSGTTDATGTCTISGVQPSFGVYGAYDVVVTPQVAGQWDELIADLEVPIGVDTFVAAVSGVAIKPVVTTDLADVAAWDGDNAVFTAIASGDPAPDASWTVTPPGGSEIAVTTGVVNSNPAVGSTRSILTITADVADDGSSYRATFTNQSNAASPASEVVTLASTLSVASIVTEPVDTLVWQGDNAVFTAATEGAATTVQWQRLPAGSSTWADMSGRTSPTLSVPTSGTGAVDDGDQFRAVFTLAGAGTRQTAAAALTVVALPSAPADNTVWAGKSAEFAAASSDPSATVRWEVDAAGGTVSWATVPGATSTTLTIASTTTGMNGNRYRAVFTVAGGTTRTTASALLTVKSATAPSSYNAWDGETVVFSVPVSPNATGVSVQWQQRTSSGASWTNVGTGVNLTLTSVTASMDGYQYQAILTITAAAMPTSSAILTLGPATLSVAEITTQPASAVVVWAGDSFSVSAAATNSPSVQWQRDPSGPTGYTDISGATNTTYTIAGASLTTSLSGSRFQAIFTLMNGLVASTAITTSTLLTVASITSQPSNVSKNAGQNASFSANCSYAGATVQWQVNSGSGWSDVAGATNTSLTLSSVTAGMDGNQYRAVFTIAGITVPDHASDPATLTVN